MDYEQKKDQIAGGILLLLLLLCGLLAYGQSLAAYGQSLISSVGTASVATKVAPKRLTLTAKVVNEKTILINGVRHIKSICKDGKTCWCPEQPAAKKVVIVKKPAPKVVAPKPQPKKVVKRVRKVPAPLPPAPKAGPLETFTPVPALKAGPVESFTPVAVAPAEAEGYTPGVAMPKAEPESFSMYRKGRGVRLHADANAAVGVYGNGLGRGMWYWVEAMGWVKTGANTELGAGAFYSGGRYHSRHGGYRGKEGGFGVEIGGRVSGTHNCTDSFGQINDCADATELKLRHQPSYRMSGRNKAAGYHFKQSAPRVGLNLQHIREEADGDLVGATLDVSKVLGAHKFSSSYSGDRAKSPLSVDASVFHQHKLSKDWDLRAIGGLSWASYDHQPWLRAAAEFRYKNTVMIGPSLGLPIGKASAYRGVSWSKLITPGAFIRAETGGLARRVHEKSQLRKYRLSDQTVGGATVTTSVEASDSDLLPGSETPLPVLTADGSQVAQAASE